MNINNNKVKLMQVSAFLIKNHGYRFVSMKQNEDEMWLANEFNAEMPVIRLSTTSSQSIFFDKVRLLKYQQSINQVIKREGRLMDIHLVDETVLDDDEEIEVVILNSKNILGLNISNSFPNIKNSIYPFNDADEEYNVIVRDLEQYQNDRIKQKRKMKKKLKINATFIISIICVVIHLLVLYLGYKFGDQIAASIVLGAYYKSIIVIQNEFFRFFTSGFIHIGLSHLLMNLLSFYYVGNMCEEIFGHKKFLFILFSSIISGSVLTYLLSENIIAVGLSGGLYGIMGAFFVYAYTKGMYKNKAFRAQLIYIVFMNLLLSTMPGIGIYAHLGGLVCGVLCGFLFNDYEPWAKLRKHTMIAVGFLVGILFVKTYQVNEVYPIYLGTDEKVAEILSYYNLDDYANRVKNDALEFYIEYGDFE